MPKPVYERRQRLQVELESAPDAWFRFKLPELWHDNRKALADFLRVNVDNLVLSDNATDAINSVLKSIEFAGCTDAIFTNRYTYGAIKNAVEQTSKYRFDENNKVRIVEMPSIYPVKCVQSFLTDFDNALRHIVEVENLRLRLVIIDHISSATATLYPINDLIQIVRKWESKMNSQTFILIDAAHAIGQVEIDLNQIDCDFYVSNLHKWFFSSRGCAFLYFKDSQHGKMLKPNVTGWDFHENASLSFRFRGTADNTAFFLVRDCIEFQEFLGGYKAINEYCTRLLTNAVEILTDAWKTTVLEMPYEMQAPFMRNIKLPQVCDASVIADEKALVRESLALMKQLYETYNIIAAVMMIDQELYVRISAFVYNIIDDYYPLRDAILIITKRYTADS